MHGYQVDYLSFELSNKLKIVKMAAVSEFFYEDLWKEPLFHKLDNCVMIILDLPCGSRSIIGGNAQVFRVCGSNVCRMSFVMLKTQALRVHVIFRLEIRALDWLDPRLSGLWISIRFDIFNHFDDPHLRAGAKPTEHVQSLSTNQNPFYL